MWLLVRSGPDEGAAVEVTGAAFVLGRQRGCDLIVRDARASRRHLELMPAPGGALRLRDLGSANGTLVDGEAVEETTLEGGEEIRIGAVRIDVVRGAPPGGARSPAGDEPPRGVATYSGVRRLVEQQGRHTRRAAVLAAAGGAVAAAAIIVVLLLVLDGGDDAADRVPGVVAEAAPATVLIAIERDGGLTASGSGWVLDAEAGLVVTAAHVVNEGTGYVVAPPGGEARPAELLASAPCEDLALLRVQDTAGLRETGLAPPGSVEPGETVVALGFPEEAAPGDPAGSTTGVVSLAGTRFEDPAADVPAYPDVIQTDTALNPGNSGGPLVDLEGRVVGVNAAARTRGSTGRPLQNVNYAIAIDRARPVLETLRDGRGMAWTGLRFAYPTDEELAEAGLPPGVRITGGEVRGADEPIEPGSLLVGVDGEPVANTLQSYCELVGDREAGDEVTLHLLTPGRRSRLDRVPVTLR